MAWRRLHRQEESYKPVTASPSLPGLFTDHPIHLIDPADPLVRHDEARARGMAAGSARLRIGYACLWEPVPERTWSYSAWNLRAALRLIAETTDIGVQIPRLSRLALKAIHTRYRGGRLTTSWSYSRLTDAYNTRALRREFARNPAARNCDAVLMIDDLAALPVPFFIYYDSSWDALISANDSAAAYAALRLITPSTMARRRERQLAVYERASGIIAMSHWFARSLVEQSGISPGKVHVVHPGVSAGRAVQDGRPDPGSVNQRGRPLRERASPRRRLLFVGRQYHAFDFYRKGGDLVVAALALLRRDYDPQITLTIAGPEKWPLPGTPPDGVRFLGALPPDDVSALYDSHDLFVMPSRLEPFGIVFAEALSRGLPCVARDAYAMPEIVTPGISGALIATDDEHELAATVAAALADDALYESCYTRSPKVAEYFSWERAAGEVAHLIAQNLRSEP
jgi:glycosyltransferase involved in cell wall biosynthesis